jgi:hypothetical protein
VSLAAHVLLSVMGVFYVVAGLAHFVRPDFYLPMMPPWLPAHRELIFVSGLAEVVLGVAVLVPRFRRVAARGDHRTADRHLPGEPPHRTARRAALRCRPGGGNLELGATTVPGSADRLGMVIHLSGCAAGPL